jgi:predicted nuclease of predicted toxin-antitoxin system
MGYRVLVDENTSPRVAEALRGKGIAADHVHEALSEGVDDEAIAAFAREGGYVVLTHDTDFLDVETRGDVPVLYYADDTMDTYAIADRVAAVVELVPEPTDLPPIVNLNEWG